MQTLIAAQSNSLIPHMRLCCLFSSSRKSDSRKSTAPWLFHCQAETIACCIAGDKGDRALASETFKSHAHLHSHQLLSQCTFSREDGTAPRRRDREGGKHKQRGRKWARERGREIGESWEWEAPDGTVKRIHNGNTKLLSSFYVSLCRSAPSSISQHRVILASVASGFFCKPITFFRTVEEEILF